MKKKSISIPIVLTTIIFIICTILIINHFKTNNLQASSLAVLATTSTEKKPVKIDIKTSKNDINVENKPSSKLLPVSIISTKPPTGISVTKPPKSGESSSGNTGGGTSSGGSDSSNNVNYSNKNSSSTSTETSNISTKITPTKKIYIKSLSSIKRKLAINRQMRALYIKDIKKAVHFIAKEKRIIQKTISVNPWKKYINKRIKKIKIRNSKKTNSLFSKKELEYILSADASWKKTIYKLRKNHRMRAPSRCRIDNDCKADSICKNNICHYNVLKSKNLFSNEILNNIQEETENDNLSTK